MRSRTWGLEIGPGGVHAAEVSRSLRGWRVTRHGRFPLPVPEKNAGGEKARAAFEEFAHRARAEGLASVFPTSLTMMHRIPLPFSDRKKNLQVAKFEAEPFLPFSADQVVVDFHSPAESSEEKKFLVFAARKKDLGEHLALLKNAGLDPESVIPGAAALFYLAREMGLVGGGPGALLDLGPGKADLVLWDKGDPILARSIPPPHPSEASPDPSRLAEEIGRSLLAAGWGSGNSSVGTLFLAGPGALAPGLKKQLESRLPIPVAPLPLEKVCPDVPEESRPALAAAIGAALADFAGGIDLRREELASPRRAQQMKGRLKLLSAYGAVLLVLGIAAFLTNFYLLEKRYRDLRGEIRREFTQALPEVKRVVNEVEQLRARVREERARLGAFGGGPDSGSPLEILRELSLAVEPAAKVRVTELVLEPEAVEVSGEADSFDAVNQLKARLERSGRFREVQLKAAKASSLENLVEFKLQMNRGGGG